MYIFCRKGYVDKEGVVQNKLPLGSIKQGMRAERKQIKKLQNELRMLSNEVELRQEGNK